jgi:hypothetical protein
MNTKKILLLIEEEIKLAEAEYKATKESGIVHDQIHHLAKWHTLVGLLDKIKGNKRKTA